MSFLKNLPGVSGDVITASNFSALAGDMVTGNFVMRCILLFRMNFFCSINKGLFPVFFILKVTGYFLLADTEWISINALTEQIGAGGGMTLAVRWKVITGISFELVKT